MGLSERKMRERMEAGDKILEVAEELIVNHGFEAFSIRNIASRIEYSTTKVYAHFKSKQDILLTLLDRQYREVGENFRAMLARNWDRPDQCLRALVRIYIEYGLVHPRHFRLWYDNIRPQMEGAVMYWTVQGRKYQAFGSWLRSIAECQAAGLFPGRTAEEVFQLIWANVHGFISLRIAYPEYPWLELDRQLDAMMDMIIGGLAVPPAAYAANRADVSQGGGR